MIKRAATLLRDRRGFSVPLTVAVTLALVFAFAGISEYLRLIIIAQGVRDAVQSSVISVVTENYDDVYHSVREGYAAAWQPDGGAFSESIDYGDIYTELDSTLGLHQSGGQHISRNPDGSTEYTLSGLRVEVHNAPLAPGSADSSPRFTVDSTIRLEVPVSFGGQPLPPMTIDLKVSGAYTPKF